MPTHITSFPEEAIMLESYAPILDDQRVTSALGIQAEVFEENPHKLLDILEMVVCQERWHYL